MVAKPLDLINLTVEIKTFNVFLVLSVVDNVVLNLGTKNFFKSIRKEFFMIIELVKYPVLTEKSVKLLNINQYTFDVDIKLTKPQIRNLIEETFQVNVIAVNTHCPPRKKKRLGYTQGHKTSYKRVIISVKRGESIEILPTA